MSDNTTNSWTSNLGITLPDRTDATHNLALSPLYGARSGGNDWRIMVAQNIGREWYLYSSTSHGSETSYRLNSGPSSLYPSRFDGYRSNTTSLRYLVSTINS